MIDYLTFIEELTVVENLLKEGKDPEFNIIITSGKIRDLKRKYEKRVSDFESVMAPKRTSSFMENYQEGGAGYDDTKKEGRKEIVKDKKFEKITKLAEKRKTDNKPLPTDIIVRDSDRVGYPVAIGQMLPRILGRIGGKS